MQHNAKERYVVFCRCLTHLSAPPWVGSRSPDGWLVVGSCTSHPGVLGSIPKREEPGKTGAPCIKVPGSLRVPAPPWVGSRSPDGWDQIPRWAGDWACTSHPGVLGLIPKREEPGKTGAPCVKVPGSSRVPCIRYCSNKHTHNPGLWLQIPAGGGWACTSHPGVLGSIPKREEPEKTADNAKARYLYWKPFSWLGTIRPSSPNYAFHPNLWATFVSTTLGLEVPILSSLPRHHNNPLAK
jgi:hypothetical protein